MLGLAKHLRVPALVASALLCAGSAHAAPAAPTAANPVYLQLLGGAALGNTVSYYLHGTSIALEPDATDTGQALALTGGVAMLGGLSVEADVLATRRNQNGGTSHYQTTSLMADLKYTAVINDTFSVYGAAGLGYVWYGVTDPFGGDNLTAGDGYQFILGADAKVTSNISLVGEVRYQDTFAAHLVQPANVDLIMPTTAVLTGLQVGF